LVQQYETDGNRNVRIKRLESVINKVFHRNNRGGLVKWIQDYEDAFTELSLLGQKTWNDDEIKKRRFVQNAQNIGLVDTFFEEVVSDKSFIETCNFLRSHTIRLDQQYKEKAASCNTDSQCYPVIQFCQAVKCQKVSESINQMKMQSLTILRYVNWHRYYFRSGLIFSYKKKCLLKERKFHQKKDDEMK
jgi:hypothetical protein